MEKAAPAVQRVSAEDPVANAIAFARFDAGTFGWNVADPGHGLVIANATRPPDAAAAAPLSAAALLCAGIANGAGNAIIFTLFQRLIPEAVRGRAFGLIITVFGRANPLGTFAAGVLLHVLPLYWAWALGFLSTAALAFGLWRTVPADLDPPRERAIGAA